MLAFSLPTAVAGGATYRPDTMPVKDIKPGMKGYGLTVFEGTEPSRFDIEVIDVLTNFRPRQDLILIKTFHPRLEVAKVVAGMSGSPVYINGKMIGAYAYGWTFGEEPVAGVTPIKNMLEELVLPLPDEVQGWPLMPTQKHKPTARRAAGTDSATRFRGEVADYDLSQHAKQLAERRAMGTSGDSVLVTATTPLLMGGLTGASMAFAEELLSPLGLTPLQAGGGGTGVDPKAPRRYVDGGAIGVQLIRGDINAMGLGTVTRVEGDRLVAFGHPMMQSGVTALPTAVGRVLWFMASKMRSFKIGMPVRPVGALVNDRNASIVVSHSAQAPVVPVSLTIKGVAGLKPSHWNFEIAHEKFMAPSFLAVAIGNALQAIASERQDISWSAHSLVTVRDYGELTVDDFGVSVGGTPDTQEFAQSNLVAAVGALMNNPWNPVIVEGVETEIELRYSRDILRLVGAELLDPEVDAGESTRIRLTLRPYSGPEMTRVVSLPIPPHLAGKTLAITLKPGYLEDRDAAKPENVEELLRALENPTYPPRSVVMTYSAGDGAVSYKGMVATGLPAGMLDMLQPTSSSVSPDVFGSEVRHIAYLPGFMVGQDKVELSVKPVLR